MEDHRAEHGFADVAAVEAFGERDRLVDLGDDDPLVVLAAELAALDDLAGQTEPLAAAVRIRQAVRTAVTRPRISW
ncbi:hypothetical protein [Streptomyces tendae]|uniref:hypothetical protein n=1 Tax=Streptomyces tendae TaxID=1932 RepID=UPI003805CC27